jgi:RNase H-like domain found in reverse transcriptase
LSQNNEQGVELPLAFFSVKLTGSQKAWATVHKEAYVVLVGLKKFRNWIWGAEIHIFSDHNPLKFLSESSPKSAKLMRWNLALQELVLFFIIFVVN